MFVILLETNCFKELKMGTVLIVLLLISKPSTIGVAAKDKVTFSRVEFVPPDIFR